MTRRGGGAHAIGQVQDQLPSARASPQECRLSTRSQGYGPLLRGAASGNLHAHDQECSWHTSRSAVWPDGAGQPAVCADPCNGPAGGQIEYVCAAAECIDPWFGAGVGPLESPAAREAEGFGAALHEDDHLQGISGDLVVHPEFCAALVRVNRHQKAAGERAFGCVSVARTRSAERDQSPHASLMRRAWSSGPFRNSREAELFGPPW